MPDSGSAPTKQFIRSDGTRTGSDLFAQEQAAAIGVVAVNLDYEAQEMAVALTNRWMLDGGNQPSSDLTLNSFKFTGVGAGTARTHFAALSQVQDSTSVYAGTSSGTDTITATLTPAVVSYVAGQRYHFIAGGTNTGAATINFNSVGAKSIKKGAAGGTALGAGDITSGGMYTVEYDGTNMQLVDPGLARNVSAFAATILDDADAAAVRTTIGAQQSSLSLLIASNLSDVNSAATSFGNIKQAATTAATGVVQLADQAAQEASTAGRAVTSDVQRLHPTAAKGWVQWDGNSSSVGASFGVSSITDNGAGDFTANWSTAFSGTGYAVTALAGGNGGGQRNYMSLNPNASPSTSAFRVIQYNDAGSTVDGVWAAIAAFGDL